ncbi:glycoside hydrolase superfamily [Zopfochytrium polystomum]|nr:glycoside hydrolase superfamily [Zopfochytrium polystomum]
MYMMVSAKLTNPTTKVNSDFKRIACYAGWSSGGGGCGLAPSGIPFNLYTHVIYAFAGVGADGSLDVPPSDDATIKTMVSANNGQAKLMLSVGGWAFSDPGPTQGRFAAMVSSTTGINRFCSSAVNYLTSRGLNCLDIDWEYPVADDRSATGKFNYDTNQTSFD